MQSDSAASKQLNKQQTSNAVVQSEKMSVVAAPDVLFVNFRSFGLTSVLSIEASFETNREPERTSLRCL